MVDGARLSAHPWSALVTHRGGEPRVPGQELWLGAPFNALLFEGDGLLPAVARLGEGSYLLKAGRVGGGEGEAGSRPVDEDFVTTVLDAALAGDVEWEVDPDFGYEVAAFVPGVELPDDGMLVPRLLYTRADRVYEHAAIVPRVREEVRALVAGSG